MTISAHKTDLQNRSKAKRFYLSTFAGKEWCKSRLLAQRGLERGISETGYGYFGARYMDHELTTMCLNVKKVETFGSNTESENEEKDENY